jgi:hypothetical protein
MRTCPCGVLEEGAVILVAAVVLAGGPAGRGAIVAD